MAVLYVTREVEFSAAHRLSLDTLSESENFEVFGKCANAHGHGHNYVLEVTVAGVPDPKNHMILHFSRLNRILTELVVEPLDHRNLNADVPLMKGVLPTSENLVLKLWDHLAPSLGAIGLKLHKLRLASTPRNVVEYYGPGDTGGHR